MGERIDRERLGRIAYEAWMRPFDPDLSPSPPWDQLGEPVRELNRLVAEAVARAVVGEREPRWLRRIPEGAQTTHWLLGPDNEFGCETSHVECAERVLREMREMGAEFAETQERLSEQERRHEHEVRQRDERFASLERRHRNLLDQVAEQSRSALRREKELDALHYVWCSGSCDHGVHRFDGQGTAAITDEVLRMAVRNTRRLVEKAGRIDLYPDTLADVRATRDEVRHLRARLQAAERLAETIREVRSGDAEGPLDEDEVDRALAAWDVAGEGD